MKTDIKGSVRIFAKRTAYMAKEAVLDVAAIVNVLLQSDFSCGSAVKKIKTPEFDEAIIIANGPSFKETLKEETDIFAGKAIICVNDFAMSEHFGSIKPDFNIFFDSIYWTKDPPAWLRYPNEQVLKSLKERVTWPMTLIMPISARRWSWFSDLPRLNKNISICYVNCTRVDYSKNLRNFLYSRNLAMPRVFNVLIPALILTINMGYKKIFFTGADHSWHEDIYIGSDNVVRMKLPHFYPEKNLALKPIFKDIGETEIFKMHELLNIFAVTFEGHHQVAEYAKFSGADIYNISRKSYIDAYERLDPGQKRSRER